MVIAFWYIKMMHVEQVTLSGQYIYLEPLNESHISELIIAGGIKYITWPSSWPRNQYQPEMMEKYIRKNLEEHELGKRIHYAVKHKLSSRLIGMTAFCQFQKAHYGLEIGGTWYIEEFQRTAANTESKYLMLKHAFEKFHCIRVQFRVNKENVCSTTAIKRLGAIQEGVLRNSYLVEDRWFDVNIYSIIIEQWPQVKLKLEQMLTR